MFFGKNTILKGQIRQSKRSSLITPFMFDINSEVVSDSIFAKKRRLTDQNPTLNSPFLRHLSNYYKNSRKGLRICAIAQVYTTRVICVFSKMNDTTGRDHVETTKC